MVCYRKILRVLLVKIGILNADTVRPELVGQFNEYLDMFGNLLLSVEPGI